MVKHRDYSCCYTVGGKVRINESTEDAIIRQIKEETGIDYAIENLSFVQERFFTYNNQEQYEITFYYRTKENINTKNLMNKYTPFSHSLPRLVEQTVENLTIQNDTLPDFWDT